MLQSICILLISVMLCACAAMPNSGPSATSVRLAADNDNVQSGVVVQKLDENLVKALLDKKKMPLFSEVFDVNAKPEYRAKPGDFLQIIIWEAPPNIIFGGPGVDSQTGAIRATKAEYLPSQMVMEDGKITVPFAGHIYVKDLTTRQIENIITKKLEGQANRPQVLVSFAKNNASTVTVVGDLRNNTRMPITPRGERVLDAVAAGGGAAEAIKYTAVQLSRGEDTAILPLETIIKKPKENVILLANDVLTAMYQPKKYSIMGAVMQNAEIPFEVQGISLAQALVRAGGLNDLRANPNGIFIFRFEKTPIKQDKQVSTLAADGTVPTIYAINLEDAGTFFVTQNFMIEDGDVIYVANAQAVGLGKFLALLGNVVDPFADTATFIRTIDLLNE